MRHSISMYSCSTIAVVLVHCMYLCMYDMYVCNNVMSTCTVIKLAQLSIDSKINIYIIYLSQYQGVHVNNLYIYIYIYILMFISHTLHKFTVYIYIVWI